MSFIKCPECNNEISSLTEICPKCGHLIENEEKSSEKIFTKIDKYKISWKKTARTVLNPYIEKVCQIIPKTVIKSFYEDTGKIIANFCKNKIKEIEDEGNLKIIFSKDIIFFIKYNLFKIVYIKETKIGKDKDTGKEKYAIQVSEYINSENEKEKSGAFSNRDNIEVSKYNGTTTFTTPSYTLQQKQANVTGRALTGGIVAGPVGAVIGAESAKNQNQNNNPIILKSQSITVEGGVRGLKFDLYYTHEKYGISTNCPETFYIFDCINNSLTKDNIITSEILGDYFRKFEYRYDDEAQKYVDNNLQNEKNRRKQEYWDSHKIDREILEEKLNDLKDKRDTIENNIKVIDENNKGEILLVEKKYDIKFKEESEKSKLEEKLNQITEEINKLSIFKITQKSQLKKEYTHLETEIIKLNEIIKEKRKDFENKKQEELDFINLDRIKEQKKLDSIQGKITNIELKLDDYEV